MISRNDHVELTGIREGNLFIIKMEQPTQAHTSVTTSNTSVKERLKRGLKQFHHRFGHVSYSKFVNIIKNKSVEGVNDVFKSAGEAVKNDRLLRECGGDLQEEECVGCLKGKMNRAAMTVMKL